MADSPNLRSRRFRAHNRGDHTLCLPRHCKEAAKVSVDTRTTEPLADVARALLADYEGVELPPLHRRLLLEAARIVERLDNLDATIRESGDVRMLAEARAQALALKSIAAELRSVTEREEPAPQEDPLDAFRRQRQARQSGA